jgi:predicted nuclease with RNAse H fold
VRTLGIDLSASPKKTAVARIVWEHGTGTVNLLRAGFEDEELVELMAGGADWTGIDAPFGWPSAFVESVTQWAETGQWVEAERTLLRYRRTDLFVQRMARLPLSVSSDRIAVTAMRCAHLLTLLAERRGGPGSQIERTGQDQVVEVYPGAALPLWSDTTAKIELLPTGYKGAAGRDAREVLVGLLERAAPWLILDAKQSALMVANDDVLDAVLCAMVARAAAKGLTMDPQTTDEAMEASLEGWIHLPEIGSLAELP